MLERAPRARASKSRSVTSLHPEAMAALQRGDTATHDRILVEAVPALAQQVDLVLLAQASMARVAPLLEDVRRASADEPAAGGAASARGAWSRSRYRSSP